jgi:DNA-nicking Smr family endonuclease
MKDDELVPASNRRSRLRRLLSADEEEVWGLVSRTVKPLRPSRKSPLARHKPAGNNVIQPPATKPITDHVPRARMPQPVPASPPVAIARREKQQLARGRLRIDARIDLHGMTQAQAHSDLLQFLYRSQSRGARFVLVITGKGAPDLARSRGVLRQQVPLWLALPEFRALVLGFDVAHLGHGGDGALYVRLRKPGRQ